MPSTTIPFILPATARGWAKSIGTSSKDQQVINGLYEVSRGNQSGNKSVFLQKRPGSTTTATYASGVVRLRYYGSFFSLYATPTALYDGMATNLGTLSAAVIDVNNYVVADAIISGVGVAAFVTTDGAGWFLYSDAGSSGSTFPTFTGDRTSGSATISGIADTSGIYKGQAISGTGIPADTRVLSVDSGTQITMSKNATSGSATSTTITKEAVAKITDAQFPSDARSIVFMDGYFFAASLAGNIYNSAINDPSSWASSDVIATDYSGDRLWAIFKIGANIAAAGEVGGIQYFYNAGNASGSVLSRQQHLDVQGLRIITCPVPFADGSYCVAKSISPNLLTTIGDVGLYKLNGTNSFTKVSDDFVSGLMADLTLTLVGDLPIGNKALVVCHGTDDATFVVYDPGVGECSLFSLDAAITSSFSSEFTKSGSSSTFSWAPSNTWTDSSSAYTLTAQTQPIALNGGKPFIISQVDLVGADTESTGTASLSASRDDYANWDAVGSFDMTSQFKSVHALGWFPSTAALRVTHSANTNFRAQALRVTWEKCG